MAVIWSVDVNETESGGAQRGILKSSKGKEEKVQAVDGGKCNVEQCVFSIRTSYRIHMYVGREKTAKKRRKLVQIIIGKASAWLCE